MNNYPDIYQEVIAHYRACDTSNPNINDIWSHTIDAKGQLYSRQQLMNALAPGSRVQADLYDYNYFVDPALLDLENPVTAEIIQADQSDFGNPIKDVNIGGRKFSSKYVSNVVVATEIITRLKSIGIDYPSVMEIGSGLGFLLQILKHYYGNRITLYAVDLPETLLIQEWLLRNWFPASTCAFKGCADHATFAQGGINFVNAYVLGTQDIAVNAVINIESIQEMDRKTSDEYFRYAARNLSSGGFFYFENHFGHGSDSVSQPTEHEIDPSFTTVSTDMGFQCDTLNAYETLKLVLAKVENQEDVQARCFVHRLLWNTINAGFIDRNERLVERLNALPRSVKASECAEVSGNVLSEYQINLGRASLDHLYHSATFDPNFYLGWQSNHSHSSNNHHQSVQDFLATMLRGQWAVNQAMHQVTTRPGDWSVHAAENLVKEICTSLTNSVCAVEGSAYKTANLACFLLPLGEKAKARDLLVECASRSEQDYWLVRIARILSLYQFFPEAATVLKRLKDEAGLRTAYLAMVAETRLATGEQGESERILSSLFSNIEVYDYMDLGILARLSAKMGRQDLARKALARMQGFGDENSAQDSLEILHYAFLTLAENSGKDFVAQCLDEFAVDDSQPRTRLLTGILKRLVNGDNSGTEMISQCLDHLPKTYYSLGWAGSVLMRAGLDKLAKDCLNQSLELRAPNFMHYEFVGRVYYGTRHWQDASTNYNKALNIVPYVRHLRARALYCDLPEVYKQAGVFSDPSGLAMVFQQNQDFYSDILPTYKPRITLLNVR